MSKNDYQLHIRVPRVYRDLARSLGMNLSEEVRAILSDRCFEKLGSFEADLKPELLDRITIGLRAHNHKYARMLDGIQLYRERRSKLAEAIRSGESYRLTPADEEEAMKDQRSLLIASRKILGSMLGADEIKGYARRLSREGSDDEEAIALIGMEVYSLVRERLLRDGRDRDLVRFDLINSRDNLPLLAGTITYLERSTGEEDSS